MSVGNLGMRWSGTLIYCLGIAAGVLICAAPSIGIALAVNLPFALAATFIDLRQEKRDLSRSVSSSNYGAKS